MTCETTRRRLDEARRYRVFGSQTVTAWTKKAVSAALNRTEQSVLDFIGSTGVTLSAHGDGRGYCSNALLFAKELSRLSRPQRKALLSLLDRGRLVIVDTDTTERIERRCLRKEGAIQ